MKKSLLILFVSSFFICFDMIAFNYQGLDSSRFPPAGWGGYWSDPGGWTTIDVTQYGMPVNNSDVDASIILKNIINTVNPGTRRKLYFPAGDYYFKTQCVINVGDIWITGAGNQSTNFLCKYAPDAGTKLAQIKFEGTFGDNYAVTTNYALRGNYTIKLNSLSGINEGDFMTIYRTNYEEVGGNTWNWGLYSQMIKVNSINTSTTSIVSDKALGINFPLSISNIRKINVLKNIRVDNIYMIQTRAAKTGLYGLEFSKTQNVYVASLVTRNFSRRHISFAFSRDVYAVDIDASGSAGTVTGDGDYGYGIEFYSVTSGRITNNTLSNLRHHIILQAANHCVVSYNNTLSPYVDYCDLNDHDMGGHNNLWEGNYGKEIMYDSYHSIGGLYHTYFRNSATGNLGGKESDGDPEYSNETRYNILANECLGTLYAAGTGCYVGANIVNGVTQWGSLSSSTSIPPSLYLTAKPSYLSTWPRFGPGKGSLSVKQYNDETTDLAETIKINADCNIWPNPTQGIMNISYKLSEQTNVCIKVYNSVGMLVKEIVDTESQPVGNYQCTLELNVPGVYFVNFKIGHNTYSKKVIKH